MHINLLNQNHYSLMMNLLKRNNKQTKQGAAFSGNNMGEVEVAPGFFCQNDPKIIANWKKHFDKDGDFINSQGIAGMSIHGKSPSEWHKIVKVSDEGRQNIFDMVKKEFIQENGVLNGDTTKKSEVYADYQRSIPKKDRLSATWTLGEYERQYYNAIYSAVKASNPGWKQGQRFDPSVLEGITRESVDSRIVQSGTGSLALKSIDCSI